MKRMLLKPLVLSAKRASTIFKNVYLAAFKTACLSFISNLSIFCVLTRLFFLLLVAFLTLYQVFVAYCALLKLSAKTPLYGVLFFLSPSETIEHDRIKINPFNKIETGQENPSFYFQLKNRLAHEFPLFPAQFEIV